MNLQRPLFGRLTINGKRVDLGHSTLNNLFIRAAQSLSIHRSTSPDVTIILEASAAKLPDSSIMSREQVLEQSLAAQIIMDQDEESPFEGITIGRVAEAMASPEYATYNYYCDPVNRQGVEIGVASAAATAFREAFPDCYPHFPKFVES